MTILELIVIALAASSVVDVWFNSSIFAEVKATFETYYDHPETVPRWLRNSVGYIVIGAANCQFCFSFWASLACVIWWSVCNWLVVVLAAWRLLWIMHELSPKRLRLDRLTPDLKELSENEQLGTEEKAGGSPESGIPAAP